MGTRTEKTEMYGGMVRACACGLLVVGSGSCSSKQSLNVTCGSDQTCQAAADAATGTSSGPAQLAAFTPPADPGPGGILFAASGEVLALSGYPFPPASPDDPLFADGWSVQFTRLLVTVDDLTLSSGPNVSPGDQSCTEPTVAKVSGPWAVDLSHSDPSYLPGKGGGGEQAVPFAALSHQNYPSGNNAAFDTSGATPYAFGFDVVAATSSAMNVNLDAAGLADYGQMIADGCAVLYVGAATFNGSSCTCPTASDPSALCDPKIYGPGKGWPQAGDTVPFHLCFKSPSTYVNCQNPDNMGAPLSGDEHQRGIYFQKNASVIGQVTIHTDHPFWDSVLHDTPAHFDQFAARVVGMGPAGTGVTYPTVTLDMTKGVDYRQVKDALGNVLPWRYCAAPDTSVHSQFVGTMFFDAQSIPPAPGADACQGLRDYYDFSTYDQSTQGHLNSDGLCYVVRHYPSPR
ncbi:MAG TPA: hypothetical protein VHH90_03290 [Polyangia bacterium]|nr:hypothetical protein [Polyangia bacterium]